MSKSAKKWLLLGSIILLMLSIGGIIYTAFLRFSQTTDFLQAISGAVIIAMIMNLLFIPVFSYRNRTGFRRWMFIFTWCFPILIIVLYILEASWFPLVPDSLYIIYMILLIIFLGITCLYLFVIEDRIVTTGIVLLLSYTIVTLVLRRFNIIETESHYYISFIMIGCGMYLFGLKSVFSIERNRYLQIISYSACLLIYLGSQMMFYFSMTSRSNTTLIVYSISLFLLTLIVLLSLPVSGYVEWNLSHKNILKKILIPWVFFLLLISIRFVFPDLNSLFFRETREEIQEFQLKDYPVINKNGLESE